MHIARITGTSRVFAGPETHALAQRGWSLVVDARHGGELASATQGLADVTVIPGDVTDPDHRARLTEAVGRSRRLDALINNASTLGVSPLPQLADYSLQALRNVYETNVIAPLALFQLLAEPLTQAGGTVVHGRS